MLLTMTVRMKYRQNADNSDIQAQSVASTTYNEILGYNYQLPWLYEKVHTRRL